jgi:hypothetical protein
MRSLLLSSLPPFWLSMRIFSSYPLSDSNSGGNVSVRRGHIHVTNRDDSHPTVIFRKSHVRLPDHYGPMHRPARLFILDRVRLLRNQRLRRHLHIGQILSHAQAQRQDG